MGITTIKGRTGDRPGSMNPLTIGSVLTAKKPWPKAQDAEEANQSSFAQFQASLKQQVCTGGLWGGENLSSSIKFGVLTPSLTAHVIYSNSL